MPLFFILCAIFAHISTTNPPPTSLPLRKWNRWLWFGEVVLTYPEPALRGDAGSNGGGRSGGGAHAGGIPGRGGSDRGQGRR